jgi:hypothetical protein
VRVFTEREFVYGTGCTARVITEWLCVRGS